LRRGQKRGLRPYGREQSTCNLAEPPDLAGSLQRILKLSLGSSSQLLPALVNLSFRRTITMSNLKPEDLSSAVGRKQFTAHSRHIQLSRYMNSSQWQYVKSIDIRQFAWRAIHPTCPTHRVSHSDQDASPN
jgi:hypothetical protein